ncbi:MAG: VanZ family protein [Proteobacteria bacterium]|nr:VanZ family protein [Pseudomonadota bacterium]
MLKRTIRQLIRWGTTLAWAAGILYLSFMPGPGIEFFPHQDKVAHFAMYAGLAFLLVWSLRLTALRFRPYAPLLAAAFAAAYGALTEAGQLFIASRSSEPADFVANAIGAAIGAWSGMRAAAALERRRARSGVAEGAI